MLKRVYVPVLLAATVAITQPISAQLQHPNLERGFSPDQAFSSSEIDDVNLFNGQLSISAPIGHEYSVGAGLSYSFNLVYSSKVWDWETVCDDSVLPPASFCQHQPTAGEDFNAGLGWNFHLGRLKNPGAVRGQPNINRFTYMSPDGGEHEFHDTLHPGETPVPGVFYTRDNTYLRQRVLGNERTIEFPTGEIHTFRPDGLLREMRDRFGNFVRVRISGNGLVWDVEDGRGGAITRRHKIRFINATMDGEGAKLVKSIELAAFGTQTATYTFSYRQVSVERPCPFEFGAGGPGIPEMARFATVQMLESVNLPDGSNYWMPPTNGGYWLARGNACWQPGMIKKVALPTKGEISWTYTPYHFPRGTVVDRPTGSGPNTSFGWLVQAPGVATRTIRSSGGTTGGTWRYRPSDTSTQGATVGGVRPVELRREVISPAGDRTVHFFAAFVPVQIGGSSWRWEHGAPFSLLRTKVQDGVTLHKSVEMFKGSSSTVPERTVWLRYTHDGGASSNVLQGLNRRVFFERTDYRGGKWTSTRSADFDGLGHYRHIVTKGNLSPNGAAERRDVTTTWNHDTGAFVLNPETGEPDEGHDFRTPHHNAPWLLTTFDRITKSEGSTRVEQTFCFDQSTGFLKRARAHKVAGQRKVGDIVTILTPTPSGDVLTERYFRATGASGGQLCTTAVGAWDYRLEHRYGFGTRNGTQYWSSGSTAMPFKSLDVTIDRNTGFASFSRDVSGLQTQLLYDRSGRLTEKRPASGHGAWVRYTYSRATNINNGPRVRIQKRNNGATSGPVLAESEVVLDGYARVFKEREKLPSNGFSLVETRYNAIGWITRKSARELEGLPGSQRHWAIFSNFDAFGRHGMEVPPDGGQHAITFSYNGVRSVQRTEKVRTSGNTASIGMTNATYTQEFDRYGRLWQVSEPNGGVVATYKYDVADRLVKATLKGNATQVREFQYDGRGFLLRERHPEKAGANAGGWTTYSNHDALGHPKRRSDNGVVLDMTYDRAERLTQVRVAGGRTIKSFLYANGNSGSNKRLGKLWKATRNNFGQAPWLPPGVNGTISVTEEYEYRGRDGRPSRRVTTSGTNRFDQSWVYDGLGNQIVVGYPRCTNSDCTQAGAGPVRNQRYNYSNGFLRDIPDFVDFIGYHANGSKAHISHTNQTDNRFTADPHGLSRPRDVRLKLGNGVDIGFGEHKYDGAGNLIVRGPDYFLYDHNSRLTRYSYSGNNRQDYSYDAFGNVTRITTTRNGQASVRSIAINSAKNRVSGVGYDQRGNVTFWGGVSYFWDETDQMFQRSLRSNPNHRWETYIYNANDERVCTLRWFNEELVETWTLRGLGDQVLRIYTKADALGSARWSWVNDFIHHSDGTMLASASGNPWPRSKFHYAVDHLGSPLITTDQRGVISHTDSFWGFGEQFLPTGQLQRRRYTSHERDHSVNGQAFDLDYMHARHYSPHLARFWSIDPAQSSAVPGVPQSWNRYTYSRGNPMMRRDPDGQKDLRTDQDKAILEDPDVLAGVGELIERSGNGTEPLGKRVEVAMLITETGNGDFGIDGFQSDGNLTSVNVKMSMNIQTRKLFGPNTKDPVVSSMHTHPGTGPVKLKNGSTTTLMGGSASPADKAGANKVGAATFIVNADRTLIKVDPKGGRKAKSIPVLTKDDFQKFLQRAQAALAAKRAELALRAIRF